MTIGASKFYARHPSGYHPGKEFVGDEPFGLRVGLITRVDEINLKADIKILTGGGERYEIDLTQGMAGPRSWWGGIPEVDSLVVLGFRQKHKQVQEAVILGYLPVGHKSGLRFDPFSSADPADVSADEAELYERMGGKTTRYKRLKLSPGDVGGMSADGAELVLSKDVRMVNRAGDLIELRDSERTLVTQSIHRVDSANGVKFVSGPVRRGEFFLPDDIFQADGKTLRTDAEDDRYYGRNELQQLGPGQSGSAYKYANSSGVINPVFNNQNGEFPPISYTNGRKVFYPSVVYGVSIENLKSGGSDTFTEHRLELTHQTDLVQEVLGEIDGISLFKPQTFIEHVLGTVVGNDTSTAIGMRQYGRVLRPQLWTSFNTTKPGKFTFEEVERAGVPDTEAKAAAGAYLFRINPPLGVAEEDPFAIAIQKQGKVLVNVPKPTVERYPDARGISAEVNLQGALKMFIGASAPDKTSLHLTLEGGIKADIGHNSDTGNAIDVTYHSGVKQTFKGVPNENDLSYQQDIQGNAAFGVGGDFTESVGGSKSITANGNFAIQADRVNVNAMSGFGGNVGEIAWMVAGKSQYHYALAMQETIALGGKLSTILAGGVTQTILAGAATYTTSAGATTFNNPGGAFSVNVGTGALSLTVASGAMSLSAAGGVVSISSGLAMSLTSGLALSLAASTAISLTAPQVLLGSTAAPLGVCRGLPVLPPGSPTLDYITGLPLQGCAIIRSL